jgi:hypothetical protein
MSKLACFIELSIEKYKRTRLIFSSFTEWLGYIYNNNNNIIIIFIGISYFCDYYYFFDSGC